MKPDMTCLRAFPACVSEDESSFTAHQAYASPAPGCQAMMLQEGVAGE